MHTHHQPGGDATTGGMPGASRTWPARGRWLVGVRVSAPGRRCPPRPLRAKCALSQSILDGDRPRGPGGGPEPQLSALRNVVARTAPAEPCADASAADTVDAADVECGFGPVAPSAQRPGVFLFLSWPRSYALVDAILVEPSDGRGEPTRRRQWGTCTHLGHRTRRGWRGYGGGDCSEGESC